MNIIERVKEIILKPKETWEKIKGEEVGIGGLYISYAIILAAIPAIANLIGTAFIGYSVMGIYFRVPFGNALGSAILSYILSLIGIYIVALIADALAPSFDSKKNITNAFKATVFSMTPYWVAGILYIIPALSPIVLIAGLYGIYLFYLGLPLLMETPKEKALPYVIIVIVVTFVINLIIGLITSAIFMPRGIERVM
ncbi:MAG: Yip1 family protein [candidate division WOR-3 bacterium]